jgi:hypothetical protein
LRSGIACCTDRAAHRVSQQARKGGRAKKSDALQQAVERLVRLYPDLTEAKLKAMLTRDRFPRLIDDVDEDAICFK